MAKKPRKGEDPEVEGEGAPAEGGSKKKKLILIGAVAGVLLLGGGAGAYFFLFSGPSEEEIAEAAAQAEAEAARQIAFVDVPQMTVNLAPEPTDERPRFLRFTARLEVSDPAAVTTIQPLLPRVEDAFQTYVRELRASDLHGSAGVYRLREELLRRVNIAVHPAKVNAVLFGEVVVQ
ncbi:flagellar basal body-associated protein FliL [Salinarimonas ramus]|uniref:Flagellar protein FliL n=1 Tax=Salinarimonas ramus TaxID=690164 RepID=A0A917V9I5_9HYPH|nr:flagellar basal body-associated protein FliL [Salinarimonas ramus]GGK52261.1 flagellar basal body protein FliL [Salinarimonas ramus]